MSDERREVVAKSCGRYRTSSYVILVHEFDKRNLRAAKGIGRWVKVAVRLEEFNFGVVSIRRRNTEGSVKIWIYGGTNRCLTKFIS
jgi:hypothetical protein